MKFILSRFIITYVISLNVAKVTVDCAVPVTNNGSYSWPSFVLPLINRKEHLEQTLEIHKLNESIIVRNEMIEELRQLKEKLQSIQYNLNNVTFERSSSSISTTLNPIPENSDTLANNNNNTCKKDLLQYMRDISGSRTISGIFVTNLGQTGIELLYNATRELPGVICTQMPHHSANASQWDLFINETIYNWRRVSLVHIIWPAKRHPLLTMDIFKSTNNASINDAKWRDLITDDGFLNKEWKKQLDFVGVHLKKLQTAGVIAICELLLEINFERSIWSGRPGVNGSVKLFQLTHDYLVKHLGLINLIWTWSVMARGNGYILGIEEYWPGNDYVDVVSVNMKVAADLSMEEYQNLLNVVGDTPISIQFGYSIPTHGLLARQNRWAWFTISDFIVELYSDDVDIKTTFQSPLVLNWGQIALFHTKN